MERAYSGFSEARTTKEEGTKKKRTKTKEESGEVSGNHRIRRSTLGDPCRDASLLTGDKGPNTHWAHGKNIEITVNM